MKGRVKTWKKTTEVRGVKLERCKMEMGKPEVKRDGHVLCTSSREGMDETHSREGMNQEE